MAENKNLGMRVNVAALSLLLGIWIYKRSPCNSISQSFDFCAIEIDTIRLHNAHRRFVCFSSQPFQSLKLSVE